jgi:hypothetical protein
MFGSPRIRAKPTARLDYLIVRHAAAIQVANHRNRN